MKKLFSIQMLGMIALPAIFIGAAGSLDLMLLTGKYNHSILLILLFASWILSPFIGLLILNRVSVQWTLRSRISIYLVTLLISLISIFIYSNAMHIEKVKPAFNYVLLPFISWVIIGIVFSKTKTGRK